MSRSAYQVQLPVFTGPLDLLLHLIEQQQLDITTVSLAQVTDQYLAYLRTLSELVADDLAQFVVVAARLLLIKSRVLLPSPPQPAEDEDGEPGEDLVLQLREYRRFKQAAQFLEQRDEIGLHAYPRMAPPPREVEPRERKLDLSGTSIVDLRGALLDLLRQQPESGPDFAVTPYQVTINDKIARINTRLQSESAVTFDSLLDDTGSRIEIIVTLLAVLELIRVHRISVRQEELFGEILILPAPGPPS